MAILKVFCFCCSSYLDVRWNVFCFFLIAQATERELNKITFYTDKLEIRV